MNRLLALAPALGCMLLAPAPASAQSEEPELFQVEVLVFRHTEPATGGELWTRPEPPEPVIAPGEGFERFDAAPAIDEEEEEDPPLTPETVPLGRFQLLAAEDYRLADAAAKIARADRFSPLIHTGWLQSVQDIEETTAKGVSGRDAAARANGRVVLSRSRYLHLDIDLTLSTADGEFPLRQSLRRISLGRYHYIDHPLVSAIAIVTRAPVEEPPPEEVEEEDAAAAADNL